MAESFDESTQKELQTFLDREQAQARVQQSIHSFTSMCWDKCITGTPSTRFSRGEESCLVNCVDRFLDTSLFMVKQIEQQRSRMGQ
ncbi:mitochondrial import inner membrane translocase [Heterobasidion irregulare TC 32-1]|uniref:Mitochondrial import inner membrane translocase subunit n=1 Tax=Heterobasidion irregulare (strain TC 32-1) TaxID=747525 RepID=W4KP27_HETIT|nr:mitochondrial import inner membrane translocase [Heterobasidion irregulare TC 32-1]ETW87459.1 mitochondrial import inner membrane translocase [Heterobasidion irregulare TC 32-1]